MFRSFWPKINSSQGHWIESFMTVRNWPSFPKSTEGSIHFSQERIQINTQDSPQILWLYYSSLQMDSFPFFLSSLFPDPSNGHQVILLQWTNHSNSSWQRGSTRLWTRFQTIIVSSPLVLLLWQQHTFPQLMRMICGKRKAKTGLYVSAHSQEHNSPTRRQFRTY